MALKQQAVAIIETCEKALETIAKGKEANVHADNTSVQIATKIIETAQAANSTDAVLAAVKLPSPWVPWTALLGAMRTVYHSLPEEKKAI